MIESTSNAHKAESNSMVDGNNKYLIPDLWDIHTHYTTSQKRKGFLKLFVANGMPGVRDLWDIYLARCKLISKRFEITSVSYTIRIKN